MYRICRSTCLLCQPSLTASLRCNWKIPHNTLSGVTCTPGKKSKPLVVTPFITTPIFYVNAAPHLGHLYTATLADTLNRWYKLLGYKNTIFSTGTDEHGLKVQQSAVIHKKNTQLYCDEVSIKFKELFKLYDVEYSDFIRTTEQRHKEVVYYFWNKLVANGYIYEGKYCGWYSISDEAFITDKQVQDVTDKHGNVTKVSSETGNLVEWTEEKNYVFRLSEFGPRIQRWLADNPNVIKPAKFTKVLHHWLNDGLPDLSVSRQRSRLKWGIPVANDNTQTIYVWLDALVNYLTVSGYPHKSYRWPAVHLVGKDILKFHALYWPAFLMAAELPLPSAILCHSHWTIEGQKMSKSKGNIVNPLEKVKDFTTDGLRYFLLREGVPHSDGDYYDDKVVECLNAELCDTLGNLLSRCTAKSLNPKQIFPPLDANLFPPVMKSGIKATRDDYNLIMKFTNLPECVHQYYINFEVHKAIKEIMSCLRETNAFIQRHEPWNLRKNAADQTWLNTVLHIAMETLRISGILLQPVAPNLADKLLSRLGILNHNRTWSDLNCFSSLHADTCLNAGHSLGPDTGVLFTRIKK